MNKPSLRYRISRALPLWLAAGLCSLAPATGSASSWSATPVASPSGVTNAGMYVSLAVDANNKLHVSDQDSTGDLLYATNKGGSWSHAKLVSGGVVAGGTAITTDPTTSNPQVDFYSSTTSTRGGRNSSFNGSTWTGTTLGAISFTPAAGNSISTFTTSAGSTTTSHVSFYAKSTGTSTALFYAKSSAWGTAVSVDSANPAGNNSIVVGTDGTVHIVGYNSNSGTLTYYSGTGAAGSFTGTQIASGGAGKWCSLAIDGNNNLYLTYLAPTTSPSSNHVRFRFKQPGQNWGAEVDVADAGINGGYPSIKLDGAGNPHISFYYADATASNLSYAASYQGGQDGTWTSEVVEAGNVGSYSSLAIGSDQTVSIAYYDATNHVLKVATRQALLINPSTVDFSTIDRTAQSLPATITITNNLLGPINMASKAITGTNAGDFVVDSDTCSGSQLAKGGSCSVIVRFAPSASDPRSSTRTAVASVSPLAPYPSFSASLSGATSANFIVLASASNGGTISPTTAIVVPGGSQTFTVTPATGFSIGSVLADGSTTLTAPYTLSNVNADHQVQANIVSPIRVLESSTYFGALQPAFESMNSGWTLLTQTAIPFGGDLLLDRDVAVTLSGGYDSAFSSQTGATGMTGNIVISNGTLTVDSIQMQ